MTISKTIVIGPTGDVGSATSHTAHELGAEVVLAMRNPPTPIRGLHSSELPAGFEKGQADLTDPSSIHKAVTTTGAIHAFIYLVFGSPDNMRSTIEAFKSGGIEFVVFLSSAWITGSTANKIKSIPPSDFISYAHAQVELNLLEIFGPHGYVAFRPAYFTPNAIRWKKMIASGEVGISYPEAKFDWISPGDIGRVCGTLLVRGAPVADEKNVIRLYGLEATSQKEAVGVIRKIFGKKLAVKEFDENEGVEQFMTSTGFPSQLLGTMLGY
jgi:uncharacterized protein YbjT (DUF2867 family)